MMKTKRKWIVVLATFGILAAAPAAHAEATRTWVSGVGDDANPCSRTAPCKTFAGAISKTAAGGEIDALDPGGYGAVTITKSITIAGDGTLASVLNASVNGVVINAGANDVVTLRNLSIQGVGTGLHGISFLAGMALHVRGVHIQGQTVAGIYLSAGGKVTVDGSSVSDSYSGVNNAGTAKVTITNSDFENNTYGLLSSAVGGNVVARDVPVSGSSAGGSAAVYVSGGAKASLEGCLINGNYIGLRADAASQIRVSDTSITQNDYGLYTTGGGQLLSRVNNTVADNGNDGAFTGTFSPA